MSKTNLKATTRTELGKKTTALRSQGLVPAVVYGNKITNQNISIPANIIEKVYNEAGTSTVINLQIDDNSPVNVLFTDIQRDPVLHNFLHADFLQIDMNKEITAEVALNFIGESPVVKSAGGVLLKNLEHIAVRCLPANLPHDLIVDLSKLDALEAHFTAQDLDLPKGVSLVNGPDEMIAVVKAPRVQEEVVESESEAVGKVEVTGEKAKEEAKAAKVAKEAKESK